VQYSQWEDIGPGIEKMGIENTPLATTRYINDIRLNSHHITALTCSLISSYSSPGGGGFLESISAMVVFVLLLANRRQPAFTVQIGLLCLVNYTKIGPVCRKQETG